MEQWKPIPGFSRYEASNLGNLRSLNYKEQVLEIREFVAKSGKRYYGRDELAKKYGVSSAHIKDIVSGRRGAWSHI